MPRRTLPFILGLLFAVVFILSKESLVFSGSNSALLVDNSAIPKEFIRRQGNQLVVGAEAQPIFLRGICFSNFFWNDTLPVSHNDEVDYQRVHGMHMNLVRLYLNYKYFESLPYRYKQSGWDWLDRNIQWAKSNNVYLILAMLVPQGGYQPSGGRSLWRSPENQKRLAALWRTIAERYRNEPAVAGYDLVNEPVVTKSIDQWKDLANRLAEAIRTVDRNHLIIVERVNTIYCLKWRTYWYQPNFFLINDSNTMYTFHFYHPFPYTHQKTPWTGLPGEGSYPDSKVKAPDNLSWVPGSGENPVAPEGDSSWTYYEGFKYQVTDPQIILGRPVLAAQTGKLGSVYFDDFVIKEYDEKQNFIKEIYPININSINKWKYRSKGANGRQSLSNDEGHSDNKSLKISGATRDAYCSNNDYRFLVTTGHYYQICGWMKGEKLGPDARCQFEIDFSKEPPGGRVYNNSKEYLERMLDQFSDFGVQNNVPLYCGEFGVYKDCLENGKGGLNWAADMIDLMKARGLHFTYHSYHEPDFGIYRNSDGLPDPACANIGLIKLFTEKLP